MLGLGTPRLSHRGHSPRPLWALGPQAVRVSLRASRRAQGVESRARKDEEAEEREKGCDGGGDGPDAARDDAVSPERQALRLAHQEVESEACNGDGAQAGSVGAGK